MPFSRPSLLLLLLTVMATMLLSQAFLLLPSTRPKMTADPRTIIIRSLASRSTLGRWRARCWASVSRSENGPATERFEALVQELLAAEDLPTLALEKADAFDYNFMAHLMQRVTAATAQDEIDALNRIGEAVNFAMQQRLAKADFILRGILKAGDLKVMEAKMRKHLRAGELDTAFDVILNVNAQQARSSEDNDAAANILQHLATILSEERDKKLPAETRLLRMLLRCKEDSERRSMLLEKLILRNPPPRPKVLDEDGQEQEQESYWGPPEVPPEGLRDAIAGFLSEVDGFAQELDTDLVERAQKLQQELELVVRLCN